MIRAHATTGNKLVQEREYVAYFIIFTQVNYTVLFMSRAGIRIVETVGNQTNFAKRGTTFYLVFVIIAIISIGLIAL